MSATPIGRDRHQSLARIELMAGEEADAIAVAVLLKTPAAIVEHVPGMVQISAPGWLAFDCADVSEEFGDAWDTRRLQIIMAAYAGYITQMDEVGVELRWDTERLGMDAPPSPSTSTEPEDTP
jgi:phenol hydroxylase P2 protein